MIKWLKDIDLDNASEVGGKAAGLGELMKEDFNVPNGFVVTDIEDIAGLTSAVESAYDELGGGRVAVRSSSIAEDGDKYSFAGQYDTFLNKIGADSVETAIIDCFFSINNPRAIEYREMCGIKEDKMSVLVQRMIDPRAAGVMFTYDTITDDDQFVLIEVVEGLGEDLVAGKVIPESYTVDKTTYIPDPNPGSILSLEDVEFLADEAMHIEDHFGKPQDIEFAIDYDDGIWICQSRPVVI